MFYVFLMWVVVTVKNSTHGYVIDYFLISILLNQKISSNLYLHKASVVFGDVIVRVALSTFYLIKEICIVSNKFTWKGKIFLFSDPSHTSLNNICVVVIFCLVNSIKARTDINHIIILTTPNIKCAPILIINYYGTLSNCGNHSTRICCFIYFNKNYPIILICSCS